MNCKAYTPMNKKIVHDHCTVESGCYAHVFIILGKSVLNYYLLSTCVCLIDNVDTFAKTVCEK